MTRALAESGWRVRLLLRREPDIPEWRDLRPQVVAGSLGDAAALERLVEGTDAVIHAGGLIKAAGRRHFHRVNCECTAALAQTTRQLAPRAHFVFISSLAAREPALSDYAASKQAGEDAVRSLLGARATVLRPAAVYGPADRETLRFFQLARQRFVPLPGPEQARAALIHVGDLARLIVALVASEPKGAVLAAADDRPQGYRWDEVMHMASRAVGNPSARLVRPPRVLWQAVALAGDARRLFGSPAMLSSQKLREVWHADWSVAPDERAQPHGWTPMYDLQTGFADAAEWYRAAGWLPR
jgi:nucleoside-diphosphate-sugar epimerase